MVPFGKWGGYVVLAAAAVVLVSAIRGFVASND